MPWDSHFRELQEKLREGIDINHQSEVGITLLHFWVNAGRADIVELLLENGADVNIVEEMNWTALHFAAAQGHLDIVRLLIAKGASVTALADGKGKPGVLDRLLGRKVTTKLTPRAAAQTAGHQAIADYIGEHHGPL